MADGAGTSYCADEGYFTPQQSARIRRLAAEEYEWQRREDARRRREASSERAVAAMTPPPSGRIGDDGGPAYTRPRRRRISGR